MPPIPFLGRRTPTIHQSASIRPIHSGRRFRKKLPSETRQGMRFTDRESIRLLGEQPLRLLPQQPDYRRRHRSRTKG